MPITVKTKTHWQQRQTRSKRGILKRHLWRKREEDADEGQEGVNIKRGRCRQAEPQSDEDKEMEREKTREQDQREEQLEERQHEKDKKVGEFKLSKETRTGGKQEKPGSGAKGTSS